MNRIKYLVIVLLISSCNYTNPKNSDNKNTAFEKTTEAKSLTNDNNDTVAVDDKRCNIDIVLEVDEEIEALNDKQINLFLYSFDKSCANNVEFGEYSNEVLFKVIGKYPELVALNLVKEGINKTVIYEELSSPVSELSNIKDTYNTILESNIDESIKKELLNALKEE